MRDIELLQEYLRSGSEAAIAEVVNRYIRLAFSVAQRQLRDHTLSEEVVQKVFCLLLKKAHTLVRYESLAGWVYRSSYNISLKTLREERKRREREKAIADMQEHTTREPAEQRWDELIPMLDKALEHIPDADRGVLVLRFVEKNSMREVGKALGITEGAAKMRVGRALRKLRSYFARRSISASSTSITTGLAALSITVVPPGLAQGVTSAALSSAGSGFLTSSFTTQTIIFMTKIKTKLILVGVGTAVALLTFNHLVRRSMMSEPVATLSGQQSGPSHVQTNTRMTPISLMEKVTARLQKTGLARATKLLEAALERPQSKGTRTYPSKAMFDAMAAFGAYKSEALPILEEAMTSANPEVRLQALAGLGLMGPAFPEVKHLLFEILNSGDDLAAPLALNGLRNVGIQPEDIGVLASMIPNQTNHQLVRYLPEAIAHAVRTDPEAIVPHLQPVQSLLLHDDLATRFGGARALADLAGPQNPEILRGIAEGLTFSETYGTRDEEPGELGRHLAAVETLQQLGPVAKEIVPELQSFINHTPDDSMRDLALRALAAIDENASHDQLEIGVILAEDEHRDMLLDRLRTGTYSLEDLSAALEEPTATSLVTSKLAALGPSAREFLPELQVALFGKDDATREEIVTAITEIDPSYVIERIPRETVAQGALAAYAELLEQRSEGVLSGSTATTLENLVKRYLEGNSSWYTQAEVTEFANQLQSANPAMWNAYMSHASQADSVSDPK